jgi:tRNA pseudouridine55 synthase
MFGLLNVIKPQGMTSRRVVDHVQKLVRPAKAGHAGTLDPLATGVLVVCAGPATRLAEYVQRSPKRYRAAFLLGRRSDTEDVEGDVVAIPDAPRPRRGEIEAVIPRLVGNIRQRPPAYSALKVQGRRAYTLAREGAPVPLKARRIRVDRINVLSYEYPELRLEIHCGSGTYVRSLGRDLAELLNTGAVMSELTRTAVGGFRLEDACRLDQLSESSVHRWLLPAARVFHNVPAEMLNDDEVRRVVTGQSLSRPRHGRMNELPALDRDGRLVAVLAPRGRDWLRPVRTFPNQ